jgi:polyphosphate kinase 2 (PPK2 family)
VNLEDHLHCNGTRIIKFFLHLSRRNNASASLNASTIPRRIEIQHGDVEERKYWKQYMELMRLVSVPRALAPRPGAWCLPMTRETPS